ncbi:MAG TPA: hypothetical protein VFX70_18575, partial [Mycobacteriales bacterium]|nr:hypothetical protein [Mycobacteriales bacterium]
DHDAHDVSYAGTRGNIANIPDGLRCEKLTWDPDGPPVEDQIRPWVAEQKPFERIITRHEALILPAAVLRDEFGIPGLPTAVARNFRDKVAMKTAVAAAGLATPRFVSASQLPDTVPWQGQTVVKPRDGAGSKGVWVFDDYPAARAFVQSTVAPDERDGLEVEEYLIGQIWHVDGYLFEREPVAVQASRFINSCLAFEHGEPLGSVQYPRPDLEAWAVECVRALGGRSLTFHLELIETERGPVLVEVAGRCGGGHIADATLARTGVYLHTVDMASDVAGRLATHLIGAPSDQAYGWFCYPGHVHQGTTCDVSVPDGMLDDPRVREFRVYPRGVALPTGRSYRPENLPLVGMVHGPDPDALDRWIRELFARASVRGLTPSSP